MPMYEFRCVECHEAFEDLLSAEDVDKQLTTGKLQCPHCGSPRVERLLSAFAVHSPPSGTCPAGLPLTKTGEGPCGTACSC